MDDFAEKAFSAGIKRLYVVCALHPHTTYSISFFHDWPSLRAVMDAIIASIGLQSNEGQM
jgi:hypothetical protein